jgi:hypothetical protein
MEISPAVDSSGTPYEQLDVSRHQIRLISSISRTSTGVHLILETASLDNAPTYSALSYVWGDKSITKTIYLDGAAFEVTENLFEALNELGFRGEDYRTNLWIDAICINQKDVPEKTSQVCMMSRIYKEANNVLAWLGPDAEDSFAVSLLISRVVMDLELNPKLMDKSNMDLTWLTDPAYDQIAALFESSDIHRSMTTFFKRPYWTRMWTFQETVLTKKGSGVFLTDEEALHRLDIVRFMAWHGTRTHSIIPSGLNPIIAKWLIDMMSAGPDPLHPIKVTYQFPALTTNYGIEQDTLTMVALQFTHDRLATDPRDKLFALGGLVDLGLEIDYAIPVDELYQSFAAGQAQMLRNLSFLLEFAGIERSSQHLNLPSWVPDWDWISKNSYGVWHGVTHGNSYNANRFSSMVPEKPEIPVTISGRSLKVLGVSHDVVADVMSPNVEVAAAEDDDNHKNASAIEFLFQKDIGALTWSFVKIAIEGTYVTGIPMFQAVLRTFIRDKDVMNKKLRFKIDRDGSSPQAGAFLLLLKDLITPSHYLAHDILWALSPRPSTSDLLSRLDAIRFPPTVGNLLRGSSWATGWTWSQIIEAAEKEYEESPLRFVLKKSLLDQSPFTRYREHSLRPFRTQKGYIGFARSALRPGDIICVLPTSSMPIALRRSGDYYVFVSLCFVLGIMDGEALQPPSNGSLNEEWSWEEFVIR